MTSHPYLSRRNFLATTAAAATAGHLLPAVSAARPSVARPSAAAIKVHHLRTISHQNDLYHGWPTLARRRNGELLVVWSGGREAHVCPFGRVELMRSHDGGATWTWPRVLLDTAIDDRDAGIVETTRGSLLATTFTSLAYVDYMSRGSNWTDAKRARWQAAHTRLDDKARQAQLGTWMLRSTDGGQSWSSAYDCLVNSPHGPINLSDGRVFYAGKQLWKPPHKVGVAHSTDDGQTWQWLADIPTRAGDDHQQYHELHAVQAESGRIVVHIRNHNTANSRETLQTESDDGGKTWTEPHAIGVWGLPSHLLKLKDGRLLMSYGYRRKPFGNQVRISDDEGRTWSAPLTLSDDGASGDLGYPSTVQRDDGRLVTVWYELPAGKSHAVLRLAEWELA